MRIETQDQILSFVRESNKIEGIIREPKKEEVDEYKRFMELHLVGIADLTQFVSAYQPNARLRDKRGLDVYVGDYVAPAGDITIRTRLMDLCADANTHISKQTIFEIHQRYEHLHPFTDGNGRSGRMLWKWMMKQNHSIAPLGFLHHFYYQSLDNWRK